MSRVFLYARVSTADQSTDNQVLEANTAGFNIEPHRVFAENISGKVAAFDRPQFAAMVNKLEKGDCVVVCKLDRLGRSVVDVVSTIDKLEKAGVRVVCLQLGGMDLTSAAGKMQMQVLAAVAEFERALLVERTQAGLARVKAEGKKLGRKAKVTPELAQKIRAKYENTTSIRQLQAELLNEGIKLSVGTLHGVVSAFEDEQLLAE